jgi:hypothetical protein
MRIVLLLHERDVRRVYVCVQLSPCRDPRTAVVTRQAGVTHACALRRQHSQLALSLLTMQMRICRTVLYALAVAQAGRTLLCRDKPLHAACAHAHTDAFCPDLQA